MSFGFQNIDPPPPSPPGGGRTHSPGGEGGGGVNILEDARHSSVLYLYRILFDLYPGRQEVTPPKKKIVKKVHVLKCWTFSFGGWRRLL
jgi:hypothetical protein